MCVYFGFGGAQRDMRAYAVRLRPQKLIQHDVDAISHPLVHAHTRARKFTPNIYKRVRQRIKDI